MNVSQHRQRWRAEWRDDANKKQREPFATEREARMFVALAEANTPELARRFVRGQADASALIFPAVSHVAVGSAPSAATPAAVGTMPASSTPPGWPGAQVLFKPYARAHVAQKTGVTGRTEADELRMLENHVFPYWCADDLALTDFRQKEQAERPGARTGPDGQPLSISNWVKWLEKRKGFDNQGRPGGTLLSAKTIRNLHALLSEVLQSAVDGDDQLLGRNPCTTTKLPKVQRDEQVYLEQGQFRALLTAIDPYFRPLLVFLVMTGVRWGEAAGLLVKHVHLDPEQGQPYVEVLIAWRRLLGGGMHLGRVKSLCSQRLITLPPEVVTVLRPLLVGKGPDDPVFTMRGGGWLHHANFVNRFFAPAVVTANLPVQTRPHSLRHTHCAWLIAAKIPMLAISRRLGHSSEHFTSKRYGHLVAKLTTEVVDVLSAALGNVVSIETAPSAHRTAQDEDDVVPVLAGLGQSVTAEDKPALFSLDAHDAGLPETDIDDEDDVAA